MYADADFATAGVGQLALLYAKAATNFRNDHCADLDIGALRFDLDDLCRCRGPANLQRMANDLDLRRLEVAGGA